MPVSPVVTGFWCQHGTSLRGTVLTPAAKPRHRGDEPSERRFGIPGHRPVSWSRSDPCAPPGTRRSLGPAALCFRGRDDPVNIESSERSRMVAPTWGCGTHCPVWPVGEASIETFVQPFLGCVLACCCGCPRVGFQALVERLVIAGHYACSSCTRNSPVVALRNCGGDAVGLSI